MSKVTGKVSQIVGPVIDVEFGADTELPKIYDSLEIKREDGSILVLEVQSHIGENAVRTIAMDSSDGLSRGTEVEVQLVRPSKCLWAMMFMVAFLTSLEMPSMV